MTPRTILAILDGSSSNERLQVALVQRGDGRLSFDLRQQHYADGIGWYDQRGMELDPRQFRQLQAILGAKVANLAPEGQAEHVPTVLPFPGPRHVDRMPGRKTGSDA